MPQLSTPATPQATQQAPTETVKRVPAVAYLDQAQQTLAAVPKDVQHDAAKPLDDLRKHFDALAKAYHAQPDAVGPPLTRVDPQQETHTWRDSFADVERDLAALIGGGSTFAPSTAVGAQTVVPANGTRGAAAGDGVQPGTTNNAPTAAAVGITGVVSNPAASPTDAGTIVANGQPVMPATGAANPVPVSPATAAPSTSTNPDIPASPSASTPGNAPGAPTGAPTANGVAGVQSATTGQASAATVTGATALAATKVSTVGVKDLDPNLRAQLEQLRLQVELFYSSMR